MAEKFQCPSCGGGIDYDGRDVATMRCPYCNTSIVIPATLRPKRKEPPRPDPSLMEISGRAPQPTVITLSSGGSTIDPAVAGNVAKGAVGCGIIGILFSVLLPIILVVGIMGAVWYGFQSAMPAGENPFATLGIEVPGTSSGFATLTTSFGSEGTGAGSFEQGWVGGVDGEGRIYVADYQNPRIQVFDNAGTFLTQWIPDTDYIRSVAVARDGTVYAVYDGQIHRFNGADGSEQGVVIAAGSAVGSGAPVLEDAYFEEVALTPDGGLLAIADGTIYRFNNRSEITLTIPDAIEAITDNNQSNLEIAEDGVGNIFVASQTENAIFKFDSEGKYQQRFGSEGEGEGQFRGFIDALTIDSKGRLYTADFNGIQVFDSTNGQWLAQINKPESSLSVYDLSVTPANELLVVTQSRIFKFALPD